MASSSEQEAAQARRRENVKLALSVSSAISLIITFLAFLGLQPEKRKVLQFEYIASTSLVTATGDDGKIKILYEERPLGRLTTISGRLTNAGGAPIQRLDVESVGEGQRFPSLSFNPDTRVLSCRVAGTTPP